MSDAETESEWVPQGVKTQKSFSGIQVSSPFLAHWPKRKVFGPFSCFPIGDLSFLGSYFDLCIMFLNVSLCTYFFSSCSVTVLHTVHTFHYLQLSTLYSANFTSLKVHWPCPIYSIIVLKNSLYILSELSDTHDFASNTIWKLQKIK